jgi:hypothetical protein
VGEIPESNFRLGRDPVSKRKHPGNFSVAESPCKSAAEQNQFTDACVTRIKKYHVDSQAEKECVMGDGVPDVK